MYHAGTKPRPMRTESINNHGFDYGPLTLLVQAVPNKQQLMRPGNFNSLVQYNDVFEGPNLFPGCE